MIDIMKEILKILDSEYEKKEQEKKSKVQQIDIHNKKLSKNLDLLCDDINNILKVDIDEILNIVSNYIDIDKEKVREQLKVIYVIIKGKKDYGFDISLDDTQIKSLKNFINYIKNAKNELKNKRENITSKDNGAKITEELAFDFECLIEAIELSGEPIVKSNLDLIYEVCKYENIPVELRKKLLIEIKKYNDECKRKLNEEPINIDELKKILVDECNFNDTDLDQVDKFKEVISNKCTLRNIKEIIEKLKELKILKRFTHDRLLLVLIYSNIDIIKSKYDTLARDDNLQYDFFFETPSIWISEQEKRNHKVRKKDPGSHYSTPQNKPIIDAYEISYSEVLKNKEFLESVGFEPSYLEYGYKSILRTPHYRLKENYEICKLYGLLDSLNKPNVVSILRTSNLASQIDRFIEFGLYQYIQKYPSRVSISGEKLFATLYKAKRDNKDYENVIFSKIRPDCLSTEVTSKFLGYDFSNIVDFYLKNNRARIKINNSEEFDEVTANLSDIDTSVFFDEYIKKLEVENIGKDSHTYVFGNQLISRLKVLRIYSKLITNSKYDKKDALMYAITYGSILDQDTYDYICGIFGYTEEKDGLSKKV